MDDPNRGPDRGRSSSDSRPRSDVRAFLDTVVGETEATAASYRDAGWAVTELHPGDVRPVPAYLDTGGTDRAGLDVLVPDGEFEAVERLVEEGSFGAHDTYGARRAEGDQTVFAVVVMRDESAAEAVAIPVYYAVAEAAPMLERVDARGEMRLYVRPPSTDRRVEFAQENPESLLPDGA
ncbi:hypothetical protein C474_03325 [Halogeometricum pallidum JCM 14848]|uniref:Uncharacterized protein n=1 Tax=Halogeometricum pallidum JCM 14848 TaxID=1227487 RepID=M0DGN7_HALPD|nr:hypothetical protein [Halogeometricum pallidum]ELZ33958.1 hypothetical protein C474_03325 [Halogeometricum pallidum JCM 14848]